MERLNGRQYLNTKLTQESAMVTRLPLPDSEDFNKDIQEMFVNGDLSHIARYLQKDLGTLSKQFNPYDPTRHSPVFEFLAILWAADAHRDGLGDSLLTKVTNERERWLPDGLTVESSAKMTSRVGAELVEAVEAEMEHLDIERQISEWDDVKNAVERKRASLIAERARTRFATVGNGHLATRKR